MAGKRGLFWLLLSDSAKQHAIAIYAQVKEKEDYDKHM